MTAIMKMMAKQHSMTPKNLRIAPSRRQAMNDENYYTVHAYYSSHKYPPPPPYPPVVVPPRTALALCSVAPAPTVYPAGTFKFEAPKDDDDDDDE